VVNSNTILPAHPHPLSGELFSSWFVRLAFANVSKVHSFAIEMFGQEYGYSFWNRDIDCFIDSNHISQISTRTGLSESEIFKTTIKSYEGILFSKLNSGFNKWILPCGIYHRTRKSNWIVYCPLCLTADPEPYFRKNWRLAFFTVCPVHQIHMLDTCSKCGRPINFFRQELGRRSKYTVNSIVFCAYCGYDLREANIKLVEIRDLSIFEDHLNLINKCDQGWWSLKQNGQILPFSMSYYDVIHYLSSFLNSKVGIALYKEALIQLQPAVESISLCSPKRVFEIRSLEERNLLLSCTLWLLNNWPRRIIGLCKKYGITASRVTRSETLPYWFIHEIELNLKGVDVIARNFRGESD
jgi:hypothetical protein